MTVPPDDRALQDRVIQFLTDAELRGSHFEFLEPSEAQRAQRFSRFLARRYYRDRLSRAFRYSAKLLQDAQAVEKMADLPEFDAILNRSVLGSRATAALVGDMAVASLARREHPSWRGELLEYERAFFLQLAVSELAPATVGPRLGAATVVRRFPLRISELLTRVSDGQPVTPSHLAGETTLVFSRTGHGKVYVAELDAFLVSVLERVNGERDVDAIAHSLRISATLVARQLSTLAELGAIVLA